MMKARWVATSAPDSSEIECSGDERRERRPFLDRMAQRQGGREREAGAEREEHDARHDHHVIARDRQHVTEPGNVHRLVHRGRYRVALAGDQGRRDRADIAAEACADAAIDARLRMPSTKAA